MTGRARRGWAAYAVLAPALTMAAARFARERVDWSVAWPVWRSTVLDLTLFAAAATLLAAIGAGVHAWRRHA